MTYLYGAAGAIAVFYVIYAAVRMQRDRTLTRAMPVLCMLAAAAALALTAASPALLQVRPAQPAIAWATSALGLLATWCFLAVLATVTGDTGSHPALLAIPVLGAASAGLLQVALRAVPGAGTRPGLPFLAGELVLLTYYCPALWRIATLAWRCSRRTHVRHIDMGMRAISFAAAADLALILLRTAATIERSSGTPVAEPEITAIAVAQAVVAIQVIGGATVSIWFPGLAMLSRQGLLWCAYWRLHLLWATLRHAVPQIELPRQPGTRFNVRYRLHRRVIEIRDAQLILKPYWRSDISDQAAAAARSARLTPERRRAVVEAAVIVTALDTWQQDTPARYGGTSPEHASAALSNNLRAEATHLILVSQAMRHSRIVQHLTHTPLREIGPKRWAAHPPVRLTARRWGLAAGAAPHAGQRPPPLAWLDAVLTVLSPCVRALLQFAYARVIYAPREVMAWEVLQPENRPESQVQVIAGLRAR